MTDKRPNFFILGAPKCGTTSLAYWLSKHPNTFVSPQKETRYFSTDLNLFDRVRDYDALFSDVQSHHAAIGEASTDYFYSKAAIPNILEYQPDAKFIVMLRRPDALVWSWHKQLLFGGLQNETDFISAWNGLSKPVKNYDERMADYKFIGRLGMHVERILSQVPDSQNQVLFIFNNDLKENGHFVFSEVLNFLSLKPLSNLDLASRHVGIERRSMLLSKLIKLINSCRSNLKINLGTGLLSTINDFNKVPRKDKMSTAEKNEVINFFLSDITRLEYLLDKDLSSWKAPPQAIRQG